MPGLFRKLNSVSQFFLHKMLMRKCRKFSKISGMCFIHALLKAFAFLTVL